MKKYYVYILSNKKNGTLYVGVTSDLIKRIYQHKDGSIEGFTKKYDLKRLVYFEEGCNVNEAIKREKQLKMEPTMENKSDRKGKPGVGRFI